MYSKILVGLDGSEYSLAGGNLAIGLASRIGAELIVAHAYDAGIHTERFREMEPVLPENFRDDAKLSRLRSVHNDLILEGFRALSQGYMDAFHARSQASGVPVREVHREGRCFRELLAIASEESAGLIVLGAHGLGKTDRDTTLGSNALRILRMASCDVLITRSGAIDGEVLAGMDGSPDAAAALRKAAVCARLFGFPLTVAAVYDPAFHRTVFHTMASSLTEERRHEVGLDTQEDLHERIVDDGLGNLYRTFLDSAAATCRNMGLEVETSLLTGKAAHGLVGMAESNGTGLLVVGHYGHHRDDGTGIGSQSEMVARTAPCSVLVTAADASTVERESMESAIEWDADALERIERIPPFARPMAKAGIERFVRARGGSRITLADVREIAKSFGMGDMPGGNDG